MFNNRTQFLESAWGLHIIGFMIGAWGGRNLNRALIWLTGQTLDVPALDTPMKRVSGLLEELILVLAADKQSAAPKCGEKGPRKWGDMVRLFWFPFQCLTMETIKAICS